MAIEWVRTSHELEGHGDSVLIVGHFCGVVIRCRGELRGDGRWESWNRRAQQKCCVVLGLGASLSDLRQIPDTKI
jgi:hypothetical protein